jgi:uncharacterized membrane protein
MSARGAARVALALFYAAAGTAHLAWPEAFLPIMPTFVPAPRLVVIVTGWCELAGAAGLLHRRLRGAAGLGLAVYALCVWPANIKHALEGIETALFPTSWWYHGPRLAFQPVLIGLALWVGGWPGRGGQRSGRADARSASP